MEDFAHWKKENHKIKDDKMKKIFVSLFCLCRLSLCSIECDLSDFDKSYEKEKIDLDYLHYKSYLNNEFIKMVQWLSCYSELYPQDNESAFECIKIQLVKYKHDLNETNYQQYE